MARWPQFHRDEVCGGACDAADRALAAAAPADAEGMNTAESDATVWIRDRPFSVAMMRTLPKNSKMFKNGE